MNLGLLLQITQPAQILADTLNNAAFQPTAPSGEIALSIWDLSLKGGWIMLPLALMSVIAIYIFVERYIVINRAVKDDPNFMNNIRDFIHNDRIDSALSLCKNNRTPIARMIEKGIKRIGKPLGDVNAAICATIAIHICCICKSPC